MVELLIPEDHIYEFVYPTVGSRYTTKTAEGAVDTDKWVQNPYLHEGRPRLIPLA
jgi:Ca-activated chloride channel family protein